METDVDSLAGPEAGGRAIRGGALRGASYLAGTGLSALAAILLLHHLTVADWGEYATVTAMVAIANGLAEGGLTVTGQQAWTDAADQQARSRLLGNLIGMRIVISGGVVLIMILFALVAGYPAVVVRGDIIAGAGTVLGVTALTVALPLSVSLQLVQVTLIDFTTQLVTAAGITLLVVLGAHLEAFFAVTLAAGLAATAVAVALGGRRHPLRPRIDGHTWRELLRRTGPLAFAVVINQIYLQVLMILMSLLATREQTGLFATAYRVNSIFLGLPVLIVGATFPLLAHAGTRDEARLANALQRLVEVALVIALFVSVGCAIAAFPIVRILGGATYTAAGAELRVQCWALVGASLTQVWTLGLVAVNRQRSLIVSNALALVLAIALGVILIPPLHALGASIAAVGGELCLAAANLTMLVRARPSARPHAGVPLRALVCAAVACLCALLPLPALVNGVLAAALFIALALVTGAMPREAIDALRHRSASELAS
jgi:O-antigen/teichoic acid export membrane protein